jgi:hypothetical protein
VNGFESAVEGVAAFPSFAPLFDEQQRWLHVLHLPSGDPLAEVREALAKSETATSKSETALSEIEMLFSNRNHRCHLVAGAALLLAGANERSRAAMWRALDEGTWSAPQLAACAFLIDPQFEAEAKRRLRDGSGWPKLLGALSALIRRLPAPPVAVLAGLADPRLTSHEAKDGAHYSIDWLDRLWSVSASSDRARWLRSPTPAAPGSAP